MTRTSGEDYSREGTARARAQFKNCKNKAGDKACHLICRNRTSQVLYKVRISDRRLEKIAGLKNLRRTWGSWGPWTGLAPDDSPLLLRDTGTQEIYVLDVNFP